MIYDSTRHEKLNDKAWSAEFAIETAHSIFDYVSAGQKANGLWSADKNEDSSFEFNKSLYFGAAGTVWGLCELSKSLKRTLSFDIKNMTELIYEKYIIEPDTESVCPSYLLGETGILQLCHKYNLSTFVREKLRTAIKSNIRNPTNEALWGCPGTMLVALRIGEIELFKSSADYLFEQWIQEPDGLWIWNQDLYGKNTKYIGAGHGFFGNVYSLLEGFEFLNETQQDQLIERTINTTLGSVRRDGGFANWSSTFEKNDSRLPLTQWCHGAPGVITSLKSFPSNLSTELEQILLEAGETIWTCGPLKKGIGICHGTDGNGFALLRLYKRTRDPMWLDRARKFAMHAISQRNGRYTLWTGEIGLALFLLACANESADFPSLDYF